MTNYLKSSCVSGLLMIAVMRSTPNTLDCSMNLGSFSTFFRRYTAASCVVGSTNNFDTKVTPYYSTSLSVRISPIILAKYFLNLSLIGVAGLM